LFQFRRNVSYYPDSKKVNLITIEELEAFEKGKIVITKGSALADTSYVRAQNASPDRGISMTPMGWSNSGVSYSFNGIELLPVRISTNDHIVMQLKGWTSHASRITYGTDNPYTLSVVGSVGNDHSLNYVSSALKITNHAPLCEIKSWLNQYMTHSDPYSLGGEPITECQNLLCRGKF